MPQLTLPSHTAERLQTAEQTRDHYRPALSPEAKQHLAEVTIIAVIGPSKVGKTTTIDAITRLDHKFSRPGNRMTRHKRPSEQSIDYGDLSHEIMLDAIDKGEYVQYGIHPYTKDIYATDANSFTTNFVVMDTLFDALPQLEGVGFKKVITVGLLAEGNMWGRQLAALESEDLDVQRKRLEEARACVRWVMARQKKLAAVLENKHDHANTNARTIIDIAMGIVRPQRLGREARINHLAEEMLEVAEQRLAELGTG